jgi:hypothetical protein
MGLFDSRDGSSEDGSTAQVGLSAHDTLRCTHVITPLGLLLFVSKIRAQQREPVLLPADRNCR